MIRRALILMVAVAACGGGEATGSSGAGGSAGTQTSGPGATTGSGATGTGGNPTGGGGAPASGWTTVAALPSPRQENAVVALDGEVYVIGGFDGQAQILSSVEAYDPVADSWRDVAPLPEPRHHINAAVVDGKLYVLGGLKTLAFTPDGDSWVYDPGADAWSPVASMPAATARGGGTVGVIGDRVYVVGGYRNGAVTDVSVYDVSDDQWQSLAPLPQSLDHLAGGAVDGLVYAVGGRDGSIEAISGAVYAYDPVADSWSPRASMLTARGGTAGAVYDGGIFVFGGEGNTADDTGVFSEVSRYDAAGDSWQSLPAMPVPRHGTSAAEVGGVIYVPGGATTQAFGAVATHEAYIP